MWSTMLHVLAYGLLAPPLSVALYSAFALAMSAAALFEDDENTWKRPSNITWRSFDEWEFANMPARGFDDGKRVNAVFSTELDMLCQPVVLGFCAGIKGKSRRLWRRARRKWDAALQTWCGETYNGAPGV